MERFRAGMVRARVRAAMRLSTVAVLVATGSIVLSASASITAFAQPEASPPETPTAPADPSAAPAKPPKAEAKPAERLPVSPPTGSQDTSAPALPPTPPAAAAPPIEGQGFRFGSYGRAIGGSDLRGGKPEKILIVAHGPRVVESSYLELEFAYGFVRPTGDQSYLVLRPVVTLAFDGTLFHDTGEFDAHPAIRNMFLDAKLAKNISAWAGSRMYRGDDIYLFDYWPLDDQNMVGFGGELAQPVGKDQATVAAAVGFNRLNHPFQFQQIEVADPVQGETLVEQLNRQRVVASATASYTMMPVGDGIGAKLKIHTEVHSLPSGTRKRDDGTLEALPSDHGFLIGAEVGAFGFAPKDSGYRRHLNLFARYAKGLAAFDELAPPVTFGSDKRTTNANELTFGLSGNFDHAFGQLMLGALSRRFIDADTSAEDSDDGWEYALDARPLVRAAKGIFVGADVSYQARFPRGINDITLRAEDPAMFQIAPMIAYSPMGPSAYDRPQLRLVYRAAHLNDAARDLYVPDDPRHARTWVYFLGLQAEWWFNSSTYH